MTVGNIKGSQGYDSGNATITFSAEATKLLKASEIMSGNGQIEKGYQEKVDQFIKNNPSITTNSMTDTQTRLLLIKIVDSRRSLTQAVRAYFFSYTESAGQKNYFFKTDTGTLPIPPELLPTLATKGLLFSTHFDEKVEHFDKNKTTYLLPDDFSIDKLQQAIAIINATPATTSQITEPAKIQQPPIVKEANDTGGPAAFTDLLKNIAKGDGRISIKNSETFDSLSDNVKEALRTKLTGKTGNDTSPYSFEAFKTDLANYQHKKNITQNAAPLGPRTARRLLGIAYIPKVVVPMAANSDTISLAAQGAQILNLEGQLRAANQKIERLQQQLTERNGQPLAKIVATRPKSAPHTPKNSTNDPIAKFFLWIYDIRSSF